jgi:ADP-heptose:LPS heptosyltransferase
MNKKTNIFNGAGKFSIIQFASIIKKAEFVFTHDNVMMHIAASFRKKIFTIWGNSIPLFGEYPYHTKFWIFENKELNCRPCSVKGFEKCPEKHFKCMNDIVFDFYLE